MRIATFVGAVVLTALSASAADAQQLTLQYSFTGVDWTSAGIGGIPYAATAVNRGKGTINLTGVSGTVTKALLYWHGIQTNYGNDTEYDNANITVNTIPVVGTNRGSSDDNGWSGWHSRTYRADVTNLVTGNALYTLAGLNDVFSEGHSANGASLVVIFDDGVASNNRDLYIMDGNDSNTGAYLGDPVGWHASLNGFYAGGNVNAQIHAADCQPEGYGNYIDGDVTFTNGSNAITYNNTTTLWDGFSVPSAGGGRLGHTLYDIHSFNLNSIFPGTPGLFALDIDAPTVSDALSMIVAIVEIQPPTPKPTPAPTGDHFTCWNTQNLTGPNFSPIVTLQDRFGTSTAGLPPGKFLCTPTNKLNEDPSAPFHPDHLRWYRRQNLSGTFSPHTVDVVDQFHPTGMFVKVFKPSVLLVPTRKDLMDTPPTPSPFTAPPHFQCYRGMFSNSFSIPGVTLQDQFGAATDTLVKPWLFCPTVNKNHEDPHAAAIRESLVCYKIKNYPGSLSVQVFTNNQFGPESMIVKKRKFLCVPAIENPSPVPTVTKTPHGPIKPTATPTKIHVTPQATPIDKCHGSTATDRCVVLEWQDPAYCTCAPEPCTGAQCVCTSGHECGNCNAGESCTDLGCRSVCANDVMGSPCVNHSDCASDQLCISASNVCP